MPVTLVVLNDGATYSDITGCRIIVVSEEEYERKTKEGYDARAFRPLTEIWLDAFTPIPPEEA